MLGEGRPEIEQIMLSRDLYVVLKEVHGQNILNTELKELTMGKRHDRRDMLGI